MQQYAFSNLDHFETSSLVTRLTTDVTVLQNAINSGFRPVVRGPVMLVLGLVMGALTSLTLRAILPALGRLGYNTREKR